MSENSEDKVVVLVIEDDLLVQDFNEEALSEGGFEAAIASTGDEGSALLTGKATEYRALVTDINLPGSIDGWQVARRAREIESTFPIVYITGAAADEWASQGVPNSILLKKPFAPAQLIAAIAQLLNADPVATQK